MSIAYLDPGNVESDLQSGALAGFKVSPAPGAGSRREFRNLSSANGCPWQLVSPALVQEGHGGPSAQGEGTSGCQGHTSLTGLGEPPLPPPSSLFELGIPGQPDPAQYSVPPAPSCCGCCCGPPSWGCCASAWPSVWVW